MAWQDDIAGCYGIQDMIFAAHPIDEQRAKAAIAAAKQAGASKDDFEKQMLWHVYKNVTDRTVFFERVEDQYKKLDKMW